MRVLRRRDETSHPATHNRPFPPATLPALGRTLSAGLKGNEQEQILKAKHPWVNSRREEMAVLCPYVHYGVEIIASLVYVYTYIYIYIYIYIYVCVFFTL